MQRPESDANMGDVGVVRREYKEGNPFNVFGVHDLVIALCKRLGIVPERLTNSIMEFELFVDPKRTYLAVTYLDRERLPEADEVFGEFEFLARPINLQRFPIGAKEPERGPEKGQSTDGMSVMEFDPQRWLNERLVFWQRQLRLLDWNLSAELSTVAETRGKAALTNVYSFTKEARIRLLAPEEFPPPSDRTGNWDMEYTLVHELVHLHMEGWGEDARVEDSPAWVAKECAIDMMADALVRLGRGEIR